MSNIEQTIRTMATRRLGVVDTSIVRFDDTPKRLASSPEPWHGVWYLLSVRPAPGAPWQLLGRRREPAQLLELVGSLSKRDIGYGRVATEIVNHG
jgi:hypothetical protein